MDGSVANLLRLTQLMIDDQIDITQFQRLLSPLAIEIEMSGSDDALNLAIRIEHRLAEVSNAGISRSQLIDALKQDFAELTGIIIPFVKPRTPKVIITIPAPNRLPVSHFMGFARRSILVQWDQRAQAVRSRPTGRQLPGSQKPLVHV